MLGEPQIQISVTRAAMRARSRAKSKFLPVSVIGLVTIYQFLLLLTFVGCSAPRPSGVPLAKAPIPGFSSGDGGVSTVILQLKGIPGITLKGRPLKNEHLSVVNLDHNYAQTWPLVEAGWVAVAVLPGRYLLTKYEYSSDYSSFLTAGSLTRTWHIRCELSVPGPSMSLFFGTIELLNEGVEIKPGNIEEARALYSRLAPKYPCPVTVGKIKRSD